MSVTAMSLSGSIKKQKTLVKEQHVLEGNRAGLFMRTILDLFAIADAAPEFLSGVRQCCLTSCLQMLVDCGI